MTNKGKALSVITVLSFTLGAGFHVSKQYAYNQQVLNDLRNSTQLTEIQPGIFCMTWAVDKFSKEQLISDGFCNTYHSRGLL